MDLRVVLNVPPFAAFREAYLSSPEVGRNFWPDFVAPPDLLPAELTPFYLFMRQVEEVDRLLVVWLPDLQQDRRSEFIQPAFFARHARALPVRAVLAAPWNLWMGLLVSGVPALVEDGELVPDLRGPRYA